MLASGLQKNRNAFTLVELMIVIGIIAVLIALLLPALSSAKEQARRVECASNLRQVGISIVAFAADHNGNIPCAHSPFNGESYWRSWMYSENYFELTDLYGATDSEFICPTNADNNVVSQSQSENVLFGDPVGGITEQQCRALNIIDDNGVPLTKDPVAVEASPNYGSLVDNNAVVDVGYTYFGMCGKPPFGGPSHPRDPWEVHNLTDHLSQVCSPNSPNYGDVQADNLNPPLMADTVIWQTPSSLTFKFNHGKNWQIVNPNGGASPDDSSTYPDCQFAGSIYANCLYKDGHVEGHVTARPWMVQFTDCYWFK